MSRLREWKLRRWAKDPRCHWCGVETILEWEPPPGLSRGDKRARQLPANLATVDHLRDRLDPTRYDPIRRGERRRVLACRACNEARAAARIAELPLEELWRRSGAPPGGYGDHIRGREVTMDDVVGLASKWGARVSVAAQKRGSAP